MRSYLKLVVVLVLLLLVLPVSAKNDAYVEDPLAEWAGIDAPVEMPAPQHWKAIHGQLGEYGDIDAFSFTFEEAAEDWSVEMRVPVCGEHFEPVYPSVAVIGAGLEAPEDGVLPFALPDGTGAVILPELERLDERPVNDQFSFVYQSPDGSFYHSYYVPATMTVDIPQAGDYTVAVWEPDGHVGAYFLWLGNEHPDDIGAYRNIGELERAFTLINNGSWMGQDCTAMVQAEECPTGNRLIGDFPELDFPERNEVGEGFVLTGTIYDAATCTPLAGAEISYEIANADGEYDDSGTGTVYTNQQGTYRIESFYPGSPHIHLFISAEGYEGAITDHILEGEETISQANYSLRIGS